MPRLVFRLWVLALALLLQMASWRAEASARVSAFSEPPPARGAFDAPEEMSEELSAVDDTFGTDVLLSGVPNWSSTLESSRWYPWVEGLPKGGPPSDAPYKPPRA